MMIAAGVVLVLQALLVLNAAWGDNDGTPNTIGGHAWAAVLVVASLLGAFALFGWLA